MVITVRQASFRYSHAYRLVTLMEHEPRLSQGLKAGPEHLS